MVVVVAVDLVDIQKVDWNFDKDFVDNHYLLKTNNNLSIFVSLEFLGVTVTVLILPFE